MGIVGGERRGPRTSRELWRYVWELEAEQAWIQGEDRAGQ